MNDVNRNKMVVRYALIAAGVIRSRKGYKAASYAHQQGCCRYLQIAHNCSVDNIVMAVVDIGPADQLGHTSLLKRFFEHFRFSAVGAGQKDTGVLAMIRKLLSLSGNVDPSRNFTTMT